MQTKDLIEEQITNCRDLLKVFKDERETYGESETVNLNVVVAMIKRKQDLLTSFGKQKDIMQEIREHGHQNEESEKTLLRELGSILEQLLVIDQENEVLLRDLLRKKPGKKVSTANSINQSPDLPFCPGQRKAKKIAIPAIVNKQSAQEKSIKLQDKLNLFSRNKLRSYGA